MSMNLDTSAWERRSLGDIARASKEKVDPTVGSVDRFVAGEHMDTDDLKIHRWGDVAEVDLGPAFHRRFHPGQVLYGSRRTYLRKVAVADFDGVCANTTFVVETKDENILLPEFLPFIMISEPFHAFAISESKGSVNPYVNWSDIERFEFDLPCLDEQKRIADLLWAIESHEQGLRKVESEGSISRSVWFGEVLRQGVAEHGWTRRPVPSLARSGPTNGKSARTNDQQRGVPTLSLSAIRDGRVLGGSSVKYMDVPPNNVANFVIEHDDFLIVRGNGNKQLTGRGGLAAGGLPEGCIYPDLLMRVRFDPATIHPAFAAEQWNSALAHSELIRRAKSTNGIWKINGQDIKSHQLVVPPMSTQLELLKQLETFERAAAVVSAEAAVSRSMRSTVLTEIFGGN